MANGSARPSVLFVDDEPSMLAGLRRMLHPARTRLDLRFAGSGPEALELMAADAADVVISDMRMPGMDGARLLAEVQRRHPASVRIVLSGEADRSSVLSAIGAAQQFLAKPCDADTLLGVVERALVVRRTLTDPAVRELIGGVVSLPTLPEVYTELVAAMDDPDLQLRDVARILGGDVATSADVLRLVNSAFFGLAQEVTSVQTAVGLLGAENIRALVLTGAVFRVDAAPSGQLDARALREQALRRAALGRALARAEGLDQAVVDQAGLGCMLRDASLLLLADGMPGPAQALVAALLEDPAASDPLRRAALEAEHFGCTVPQASAYLLGLWNFAPAVVHALAGQPLAASGAPGSSPVEQILDVAERRVLAPWRPVEVGYLDAGRLESWNRVCDVQRAAPVTGAPVTGGDVEALQAMVERLNATIEQQQGMINSLVVLAERTLVEPVEASAFDGWQRTLLLNRELERRVREVGEAERLLRSVVDSLDSRMCILGADGRIVGVNRLWTALAADAGWSGEQAGPGADVFALLADLGPELAEPLAAALRQGLAGETGDQAIKGSLRVADLDEYVIVRIHPVRDHDVATLVVTVVDITEAHRTQAELDRVRQEATHRTRSLVEQLQVEKSLLADVLGSIPQLVYWKDGALRYAGVNEAFLRLRGLARPEEVIGRTEAELGVRDELSAALAGIEPEVLATGARVENRRIALGRPDGPAASLLVSVLPQTDAEGRVIGVTGVAADVTHVSTLEQQLAQATRLESIGQLAAGIAHEINTPVQFVSDNTRFLAESFGGVMVALELARELPASGPDGATRLARVLAELDLDFLAEEIPGALSQSREGLERVAQIVRAMKDFSHPGQGKAEADVNRAVESTTQVCRNEWRYVASLELSLDPAVGAVPCYEGELKQVLLNIVVNAAQAIAEQREAGQDRLGRIRVCTARRPGAVRITVADDGPGMTPEVQRRIFDPFFTTKPVGKGTGQGLSMAYASIVTKHGGTLAVESTPGEGTTVTLDLPA